MMRIVPLVLWFPSVVSFSLTRQHNGRGAPLGVKLSSQAQAVPIADIIGYNRLPCGLAAELKQNAASHKLNMWIIDDCDSIMSQDGSRIVAQANGYMKSVKCTRWKELQETTTYHAGLAGLLKAPTSFTLLDEDAGDLSVAWQKLDNGSVRRHVESLQSFIKSPMPDGTYYTIDPTYKRAHQ